MAPRICVKTLEDLCLRKIAPWIKSLAEHFSTLIVHHGTCVDQEDHSANYRKCATDNVVDKLKNDICHAVAPSVLDKVVAQILLGIKLAAEAKRQSWRPG